MGGFRHLPLHVEMKDRLRPDSPFLGKAHDPELLHDVGKQRARLKA